jgi:hypothetical protein
MKLKLVIIFILYSVIGYNQTLKIKSLNNQGYEDYTLINFNTLATDSFDFDYDGVKFPSQNGYPTIYTIDSLTNFWFSINSLSSITNRIKYVNLNVIVGSGNNIDLTFSKFNLLSSYVILWDKKLNIRQIVSSDSTYTYSVDNLDTLDYRFQLQFQPEPVVDIIKADCNSNGVNKIFLSILDSLSPDFFFTLYNTDLTYNQSGHYSYFTPFSSIIPHGEYYLKIGVISPPLKPLTNTWIKTYYFIIDSIPNIYVNLTSDTQLTSTNQTINFTTSFYPIDFPAYLDFGDGNVIEVDSGISYPHVYLSAGSFEPKLIVVDTVNQCKDYYSISIDVKTNYSPSYFEFTNGKIFIQDNRLIIIPNIDIHGIISLFDLNGKLINSSTIDMLKSNNYRIDIHNLPSGIYILEIITNNKKYFKKIFKN